MQNEGRRIATQGGPADFELDDFILGDVDFVSLNWDPIGLWAQFVANRSLNGAPNVPHVGSPAHRLALYHELGLFRCRAQSRQGARGQQGLAAHECLLSQTAQRPQAPGEPCAFGSASTCSPMAAFGGASAPTAGSSRPTSETVWEMGSTSLLPPPPLKAFVDVGQFNSWCTGEEERSKWQLGEVDAPSMRTLQDSDLRPPHSGGYADELQDRTTAISR